MEIWREGHRGMVKRLENVSRLEGGELAEELGLELEEIWAGQGVCRSTTLRVLTHRTAHQEAPSQGTASPPQTASFWQ